MQNLKKFLFLLTPSELLNASLLLIMIIVMALLEMIGVVSILPFVGVLTNPSLIESNVILRKMFEASSIFGVKTNEQFFFILGVMMFVLLIISLIFKGLTTFIQARFCQMREYSIGKRLVEGYMSQPYSWFLNHNSANLGKTVLSEVAQVVDQGIKPLIELIAKGTVALVLITLLILVDYKIAFSIGISFSLAYGLIFYVVRKYLKQIGNKRLINNELRFIAISEIFGAVKEIKLGGLEKKFIKNFSYPAKIFAQTQASSVIISRIPRFFLEAIAFGGILLIILYIIAKTGSFNDALPIVSLYVLAGYRLMPALQQIFESIAQLTFVGPSLNRLYNDLKNLKQLEENYDETILSFNKSIKLKNIYYTYPNAQRTALKDINLTITPKSTVGFIGTTGSGKTTTADILLGLLEPERGTLEIDGKRITKHNLRLWQKSIGYIPQQINLFDQTVAANIAFGVSPEEINLDLVKRASKIANLHNFVVNELPQNYLTSIGERGVRLSGGQRQRIGIARALYHEPKILILDEATSALDNETEKVVMDAVTNLRKDITIILIAHRLGTIKNCDKIFVFEKGEIKKEGNFKELINVDENFHLTANN